MKGDIPSTADYHAAVERIRDLGEQNVALQADLAATRDKLREAQKALLVLINERKEWWTEREQAQARIAALEQELGMFRTTAPWLGVCVACREGNHQQCLGGSCVCIHAQADALGREEP